MCVGGAGRCPRLPEPPGYPAWVEARQSQWGDLEPQEKMSCAQVWDHESSLCQESARTGRAIGPSIPAEGGERRAARTTTFRWTTRRKRVPRGEGSEGPGRPAGLIARVLRAGAAWVYDGGAGQPRRAAAAVSPFRAEVGDLRSLRPTRGHFPVMASRSPPGALAFTWEGRGSPGREAGAGGAAWRGAVGAASPPSCRLNRDLEPREGVARAAVELTSASAALMLSS